VAVLKQHTYLSTSCSVLLLQAASWESCKGLGGSFNQLSMLSIGSHGTGSSSNCHTRARLSQVWSLHSYSQSSSSSSSSTCHRQALKTRSADGLMASPVVREAATAPRLQPCPAESSIADDAFAVVLQYWQCAMCKQGTGCHDIMHACTLAYTKARLVRPRTTCPGSSQPTRW
jgi:hypothetical protein